MNTLSDEQLKELLDKLEGLYQKATPGTLYVDARGAFNSSAIYSLEGIRADYEFAAAIHNAFPTLLSTIESLRTKLDEARDTIERISESLPEPFTCHKHPEITGMHIIDDVRDLVKELQKTQVNEQDYSKQVRTLTAERASLQAWKDSMMQVELEWNEQKVGKLLKLPLGSSIKAGIEPAIVELIDERDSLRTELAAAKSEIDNRDHTISCLQTVVKSWKENTTFADKGWEDAANERNALQAELAAAKERERSLRNGLVDVTAAFASTLMVVKELHGEQDPDKRYQFAEKHPEVIAARAILRSQPPQSPWRPSDSRKHFEEWAVEARGLNAARDADGDYIEDDTHDAWTIWEQAVSSVAPLPQPPTKGEES